MTYRIVVLGDSSSSGIGIGSACYPVKLFKILRQDADVSISNCAVPGATSADVACFFLTEVPAESFDCVIVYLGNNEGAAAASKGRYSPMRARIDGWFGNNPKRPFRPVLSPRRFQFEYDAKTSTIATTPPEFGHNLRLIAGHAAKAGAGTIFLNPVANERFPSGLGAPNSAYFAYLDELDRLGHLNELNPVDEPSRALSEGLTHFATEEFDKAINAWTPLTARSDIIGFIASHNVACAKVRTGDYDAEAVIERLLGIRPVYDALLGYNLAHVRRLRGNLAAMALRLDSACEADTSVYRIKRRYREVIAQSGAFDSAHVLDLQPVLKPRHFVDYCHPTEEGHEAIAKALADEIRSGKSWAQRVVAKRTGQSGYERLLPSPNYFLNPRSNLIDYYCIEGPIDRARIAETIEAVREKQSDDSDDVFIESIRNFLQSNGRHPIFDHHLDLTGGFCPMRHEIFSFPEFFIYRVLRSYSLAFEQDAIEETLVAGSALKEVRISAADYQDIILRMGAGSLDIDINLTRAYFDAITQRIAQEISRRDNIYKVMIGHRIRTTMMWFTREAFRYGTQSRGSMLYPRWEIEELIEAAIVAIVIASRRRENHEVARLDRLLGDILALLQVHEKWVRIYQDEPDIFSVVQYKADLAGAENSLKAQIVLPN
jgi:hypothetical protein